MLLMLCYQQQMSIKRDSIDKFRAPAPIYTYRQSTLNMFLRLVLYIPRCIDRLSILSCQPEKSKK